MIWNQLYETNVPIIYIKKSLFEKSSTMIKAFGELVVYEFLISLIPFFYLFFALLWNLDCLLSWWGENQNKIYFIVGQIAQPKVFVF